MAIINNVAYSWSMITLSSTALGIDEGSTTLEGVSAIKWSKKRKVESNYGMGGRPVSRGFGNITYTASITMDYATQQLLRSVYGSRNRRVRPDYQLCQPDGRRGLDNDDRNAQRLHLHGGLSRVTAG